MSVLAPLHEWVSLATQFPSASTSVDDRLNVMFEPLCQMNPTASYQYFRVFQITQRRRRHSLLHIHMVMRRPRQTSIGVCCVAQTTTLAIRHLSQSTLIMHCLSFAASQNTVHTQPASHQLFVQVAPSDIRPTNSNIDAREMLRWRSLLRPSALFRTSHITLSVDWNRHLRRRRTPSLRHPASSY